MLVQTAALDVRPEVTEAMRQAGARDDRLGGDAVSRVARLAVAAWAKAVDGDDTSLAAIGRPDTTHYLLHTLRKSWQVAAGPKVSRIEITDLDLDAEPARLRVVFWFAGRIADPRDGDRLFIGLLKLTLGADGPSRWQLSSGHVETLDEYLGYVFTSRRETEQEFRQRAGSASDPAPGESGRTFRIVAGYAEHDERFGCSAEIEVQRDTAPDRYEAVQLVWPAIVEETASALGEGDWRPSLNWLDVIELLG
jgi:hypothetical protein